MNSEIYMHGTVPSRYNRDQYDAAMIVLDDNYRSKAYKKSRAYLIELDKMVCLGCRRMLTMESFRSIKSTTIARRCLLCRLYKDCGAFEAMSRSPLKGRVVPMWCRESATAMLWMRDLCKLRDYFNKIHDLKGPSRMSVEHKHPLFRDGLHDPTNLTLMVLSQNCARGSRMSDCGWTPPANTFESVVWRTHR